MPDADEKRDKTRTGAESGKYLISNQGSHARQEGEMLNDTVHNRKDVSTWAGYTKNGPSNAEEF